MEQAGAYFFVQTCVLVNDSKVQGNKDNRTGSDIHIQRSSARIFTGDHFPHRIPDIFVVHSVSDSVDIHDTVYAGEKIRELLILVRNSSRANADSNYVLESG